MSANFTLIITEKPDQAKEFAQALNNTLLKNDPFKFNGKYFENNNYLMTSCFGHLCSLQKDNIYHKYSKWSKEYLPLIPTEFKITVAFNNEKKEDIGKKIRLDLIKSLMQKSHTIINATDKDREGELIFRYVYQYNKCNLTIKRLWIKSLTPDEIVHGFSHLIDGNKFNNLAKAAYARAEFDWLIGTNATQAASLHFNNFLSIGRVQSPILRIIIERFIENKNHKTNHTYKIVCHHSIDSHNFISNSQIFETLEDCNLAIQKLSSKHTTESFNSNIVSDPTPPLYTTDLLSEDANRFFKFSPKKTLDIAQELYEKKLTTYPRTNSTTIPQETFNNLKTFLPQLGDLLLDIEDYTMNNNPKCVQNSSDSAASHDAITPTGFQSNFGDLSEDHKKIYFLIIRRTMMSLHFDAKALKKKATFINNNISFSSSSHQYVELGWRQYLINNDDKDPNEDSDLNSSDIPNLNINQLIDVVESKSSTIVSKPKPLFTPATLVKNLSNISKYLKEINDPDLLQMIKSNLNIDDLEIGTSATRAAIIETIIKRRYVILEKNKYIPTELGLEFYETVKYLSVFNLATNAMFELDLKLLENGTISIDQFNDKRNLYIVNIVNQIFKTPVNNNILNSNSSDYKTLNAKCPKCKASIIESKFNFRCSKFSKDTPGCNFSIYKSFFQKNLSAKMVEDLLAGKKILIKNLISPKTNKNFDSYVNLNEENKISLVFNTNFIKSK